MRLIFILAGLIILFASCDTTYVMIGEDEPEPPLCIADYINTKDYYKGTTYIIEFEFDNNGDIWLSTNRGLLKLSKFDHSVLKSFNPANSPLEGEYSSYISVDNENNIWISKREKLYKYNQTDDTFKKFESDNDIFKYLDLSKVYFDLDNNAYVVNCYKLYQFTDNDWKPIFDIRSTGVEGISIHTNNASIVKQSEIFWLATSNGLMKYINDSTWVFYNTQNSGIANNIVQKIRIDNEGRKWLESFSGIEMYDGTNWFLYDDLKTFDIADEFIIANPSRQGRFQKYENNQWDYFLLDYIDAPGRFHDAEIDDEGHLWLSDAFDVIYKIIKNP